MDFSTLKISTFFCNMIKVYLWLWSNLGNRIRHIDEVVMSLKNDNIIKNTIQSSFYKTEPIDANGWYYINCVIWAYTDFSPHDLLNAILKTEEKYGRKRYAYHNSRTIDIDILLYNDIIVNDQNLQIPHPRMCDRSFVCDPLLEIAPDIHIPWKWQLSSCKSNNNQFIEKIDNRALTWKGKRAIMGILNITPDSFYDGWKYNNIEVAILQAWKMIEQWADIIDIGAQSTRPGHMIISWQDEVLRLEPIVREFRKNYPYTLLSIDTFYPEVIRYLQKYRIDIINDVSDTRSQNIEYVQIAKEIGATYIATSHASNMSSIMDSLLARKEIMDSYGFRDYIFDPGFGFWKTREENFTVLSEIWTLQKLNVPILVGVSRKSMIYRSLDISPELSLNGSSVIHTLALKNGADILRVHDVWEARETINLYEIYEDNAINI